MRLFIAIQFNNRILTSLKKLQSDLRSAGLRGRYAKEENLHLTLAFIGEYDDPNKVLEAMAEAPFEPFAIELSGMGRFGDLYWAGLAENPDLIDYVKRLRKSLSAHNIPYDKTKFSPHITLVRRGSFAAPKPAIPRILQDAKISAKTSVNSVSLVKSEFTKDGMKYTTLEEICGIISRG